VPIALDPKESFDYVLEEERAMPPERQTVFLLRGLTISEETALNNTILASDMGGDEMKWKTGDYQLKTLRLGLLGWSNFKDIEGVEVEFVSRSQREHRKRIDSGVTLECLDRLSSANRGELANAIGSRGRVTEPEGN